MVKNNIKKKRISPNGIALIGSMIIVLGGFFLFYSFIEKKRLVAYDYMNELMATNATIISTEQVSITSEESEGTHTVEEVDPNTYIGHLIIPKLGFRRGFFPINSPYNQVDQNIEVLSLSDMPDKEKGNLIIAGHSGDAWNSFFNTLHQLAIGDQAQVEYKGKVYTYQIVKIYRQANTGKIAIYRNYDKTTLTLITCTMEDHSQTQTIFIAELISTT